VVVTAEATVVVTEATVVILPEVATAAVISPAGVTADIFGTATGTAMA
jgi:hypothetical protein